MYCNFHKSSDGQKWFSLSFDCDEIGIEALTILKNTAKKNLTEAVNLEQYDKVRDLMNLAQDIQTALDEAKKDEAAE